MIFTLCFIYLLALIILGWPFVLLFSYRLGFLISSILSFIVGAHLFTFISFLINIAFPLSSIYILGFCFVGATLLISYLKKNRTINKVKTIERSLEPKSKREYFYKFIFCLLILIFLAEIIPWSLAEGVVNAPGYKIWSYKAKLIFYNAKTPLSTIFAPENSFSQQSYPLNFPYLLGTLFSILDSADDKISKIMPPFFSLGLILTLYSIFYNKSKNALGAGILCILATSNSIFISCSHMMYVENYFCIYVIFGFFFLSNYLKDMKKAADQYFGFFLLACSAWVKNEGILICLVCFLFMILFSFYKNEDKISTIKALSISLLLLLVCILPWTIYRKLTGVPVVDFNFDLSRLQDFEKLKADSLLIFPRFWKQIIVSPQIAGSGWLVLGIMIVFRFKEFIKRENLYLFTVISCILIGYISIFFFSVHNLKWHLIAVGRLLMGLNFLIFFLINNLMYPNNENPVSQDHSN